jgi:hypothetical protein
MKAYNLGRLNEPDLRPLLFKGRSSIRVDGK